MKIAVIGTGYVGLVTGTCFAETGNDVVCIDIDVQKVKKLSDGEITIYEPGLNKLFLRNLKEERLNFTTNLAEDELLIEIRVSLDSHADTRVAFEEYAGVGDDLVRVARQRALIELLRQRQGLGIAQQKVQKAQRLDMTS